MNTKNTARKGFTTVELVIVIAVIAILAVVLIPTFSNLIAKANLSADKQTVRNMNICLTTEIASQIKANKPEDFGAVKELLKEYGYGKDSNFIPKSKGYSFRWFIDDKGDNNESNDMSMIVLVNDKNEVVYPEEYVGITNITDVRKYFDLSLPAAIVIKEEDPAKMTITQAAGKDVAGGTKNLAALYTFMPARLEDNANYGDWYADFYISFSKNDEARTPLTQSEYSALQGLMFAGYYPEWSYTYSGGVKLGDTNAHDNVEYWLVMSVDNKITNAIATRGELPLIGTIMNGENIPYGMILSYVSSEGIDPIFKCGVVDSADDNYKDIVMMVELRLTNNKNTDEYVVVGMYEYEFK